MEADIEQYQAAHPQLYEEWFTSICACKPGLTGQSQIYRHSFKRMTDRIIIDSMEMDLEDADTASRRTDLRWLAATPIGLLRANAHANTAMPEAA